MTLTTQNSAKSRSVVTPADPKPFDGLHVHGLAKAFGDHVALRGVDLNVPCGQLVGFLGANGAGKTTTMRAVLGLVAVDAGSITWAGQPMGEQGRRRIGYMPQERGLYPAMRVHEHIAYIGLLAGLDRATADRRANYWADRVGLSARTNDLIQELSTGNQQRVQLAVALVHEPDLLVLDEPFAGLDPVAVGTLCDVIGEQVAAGATVVFSSHQLDLVQDLAEHVVIIAAGETRATGTIGDLRSRSPRRIMEIQWAGDPPSWRPPDSKPVDAGAGVSRFTVPASSDAGELIAMAAAVAPLAAVSYEPPSLDAVFRELVAT